MELNGIDRCPGCMQEKGGVPTCPHCGLDSRAAQNPPPALSVGTRLNDQYVLGVRLGHGGFGVTYLAWDMRLATRVAIKEYMPRDFATRASDGLSVTCFQGEARELFAYGRRKFLDEARALARFPEHPGIVKVLNLLEANGTAYMVMQCLDGMDLKQYLAQVGGRLPPEVAFGVMTPVLDALRAVHEAGLLHRDISPDNIFVTRSQRVMILDFGAARNAMGTHSQSYASIRKSGYSPEEQYRQNGEQGPWTDVYAASATLYRLLTGTTPADAMDRLAEDRLEPPSHLGVVLDGRREAALMKGLAVRARDRFESIVDLQRALSSPPPSVESGTPRGPAPVSGAESFSGPGPASLAGKGSWGVPLALIVALSLVGGIGWMLYRHSHQTAPQTIAGAGSSADADASERWQREAALQAQREAALRAQREAQERRRQQERDSALRQARDQAAGTIRTYYARLDSGDVEGAIASWYSVSDPGALRAAMGRIDEARVLEIGTIELSPDLATAIVPARVRVRNHGEGSTIWSGPIHLRRWLDHWEIDTMRHLSKE